MSAKSRARLPAIRPQTRFEVPAPIEATDLWSRPPANENSCGAGGEPPRPPNDLAKHLVDCLPRLRRLAQRLGRSTADADDLVQEALLHALEHADQFCVGVSEGVSSVYHWVARILKNYHCDRYRKQRREVLLPQLETQAEAREPTSIPAWRTVSDEVVKAAIRKLPPRLGGAYRLFAAGDSYCVIASKLDIPIGTVGARIHRARRRLLEAVTAATSGALLSPTGGLEL